MVFPVSSILGAKGYYFLCIKSSKPVSKKVAIISSGWGCFQAIAWYRSFLKLGIGGLALSYNRHCSL